MGSIRIDIDDYVDEISDKMILSEFERRKLALPRLDTRDPGEVIRDAYEELLRNRPNEARAVLERVLYPKWRTEQQCKSELAAALTKGK